MLENIEIIVGTYEEFILGYKVKTVDNVLKLVQTFANHDHVASVRCVSSSGNLLASGGADDLVYLYNMGMRKQCGLLRQHNGTVSCVVFTPNRSHIITGGEDGELAIFRVGSLQLEKVWGSAHKGSGILGISVHPSGKMALSVGADGTLRTWNLVKGRPAYTTNLGSKKSGIGWQIVGVHWSPNGNMYGVGIGSKINVYSVDSAGIVCSVSTEIKICCFLFLSDKYLVIGCEDGKMCIFSLSMKRFIVTRTAHECRVKCLSCFVDNNVTCIVSASSTGEIKIWNFMESNMTEAVKINSGCRITCLTIATCKYPQYIKKEENTADILVQETNNNDSNSCLSKRHTVSNGKTVKKKSLVDKGSNGDVSIPNKESSSMDEVEVIASKFVDKEKKLHKKRKLKSHNDLNSPDSKSKSKKKKQKWTVTEVSTQKR